MTSDCSFLYPGHVSFVLMCFAGEQHHALLWSMKYKEKGQASSLCLSVLAVSHSGVCVTRLVLLGAFWEVFSSLGYVSERLWPHLALQLLHFLSCQGLETLALPHAPHMMHHHARGPKQYDCWFLTWTSRTMNYMNLFTLFMAFDIWVEWCKASSPLLRKLLRSERNRWTLLSSLGMTIKNSEY